MVGGGHDRSHPPGGARREPAHTSALTRASAERSRGCSDRRAGPPAGTRIRDEVRALDGRAQEQMNGVRTGGIMLSRRGMHSRREFLQAGAVAMTGAELGFGRAAASGMFQGGGRPSSPAASVKALVFDTFGTVVDWRTPVTQEVEQLAKKKGLTVDGAKFADAWRAGYGPSMNRVRTGELPWTKLDRLHRMTLDRILIDFDI